MSASDCHPRRSDPASGVISRHRADLLLEAFESELAALKALVADRERALSAQLTEEERLRRMHASCAAAVIRARVEIAVIRGSESWKVTEPFRIFLDVIKSLTVPGR